MLRQRLLGKTHGTPLTPSVQEQELVQSFPNAVISSEVVNSLEDGDEDEASDVGIPSLR